KQIFFPAKGRAARQRICHEAVACRIYRQEIVEIAEREAAMLAIDRKPYLTCLQHLLERAPKDWQGKSSAPVNVEMVGIFAVAAELYDTAPPRIFERGRHVVWHDVDDQLKTCIDKRCVHALKPFLAAEIGIEAIVVDDVVTVRRAARRSKD